jgi:hypothetical protein
MRTATAQVRSTRQQALHNGALIDVTDDARQAGVDMPTAISRRAWAACIDVHPETDGNNQNTRLSGLLFAMEHELAHSGGQRTARFLFPIVVARGNEEPLYAELKARRNGESLTVTLADESLPQITTTNKKPIPRHLLAELSITLSELGKATGAAEQEPLFRMSQVLDDFAAQHPVPFLPVEEHNRFSHFPAPSAGRFSLAQIATSGNSREKLLQNLQDITDTLRTVALPAYGEQIDALQTQLDRLTGPVVEMMHVSGRLVQIAGKTDFEKTPNSFVHPCDVLLSVYARLAVLADAGRFKELPHEDLAALRSQIALLQTVVAPEYLDELFSLKSRLSQLEQPVSFDELRYPPREVWCDAEGE